MQSAFSASSRDWAHLLRRVDPHPASLLIPAAARRRILVTGAGGFIGSEMVRVLAASGADKIILLEIAEQKLFEISTEVTAAGHAERCIAILGSVTDRNLLEEVFQEHRPEIVLHAAALKHVPLMERNPIAAVETNSLGTWAIAEAAAAHGARHMILVSTDKAVEPQSIMGASKRIAELITLSHAASKMRATVVRLANVLGSPCSVGPAFAEQIARGGPVTVTHPEARRFFLTLAEVVHLLGQAVHAETSGVLVPDPGKPLVISDLAQRMMAAAGRRTQIVFTALRPGDKLDESLLSASERYDGRATPGLLRVISPQPPHLSARVDELGAAVTARDRVRLLHIVQQLVPDYRPSAFLRGSVSEAAPAQL